LKEVSKLNWYYTLLIIFIILFIIAIVIIFTKIYIQISYQHENKIDELIVKITFWKVIKIQKKVNFNQLIASTPFEKMESMNKPEQGEDEDEATEGFINKAKNILRIVQKVIPIVNSFLRKITVHSFEWKTKIGSKDASICGILAGALWSVKGGVVGVIGQRMNLNKTPIISITPLFHQSTISTSLQCMISFRVGKAIYAIMQLVRYKEQYKLKTVE
jgi:hypothetical protein